MDKPERIKAKMEELEVISEMGALVGSAAWQDYQRGKSDGIAEGKKEGKEVGIAEGKEAGIVEGKKVGIAEGKKAGIMEGTELVAKRLLSDGFSLEKTADLTGLSLQAVNRIRASFL